MIPHICILIPSLFSLYQSLYLSHSNLSLTFFCCKRYCFYSLSLSLTWPPSPPPPTRSNNSSLQLSYYYWSFFSVSSSSLFLKLPLVRPQPPFCDVYRVRLIYLKLATTSHLFFSSPFPLNLIIARRPHPNPIPSIMIFQVFSFFPFLLF